jgi:hypothetical protein
MKHLLTAGMIFAAVAAASNTSVTFDPVGGAISGTPGSTIGWGFTISDSVEYVLLQQSDFCPAGITEVGLPCANNPAGTYTDFTGNAPVIGPAPDSPSVTQGFNLAALLGFGSFQISPAAAPGTVIDGEIAVVYDLFTGDPNTDPTAMQIGGDNFVTLAASVTVDEESSPEPGTMLPVGIAIACLLLWANCFRSRASPPTRICAGTSPCGRECRSTGYAAAIRARRPERQ